MKELVLPPLIEEPRTLEDAVYTWTVESWRSLSKKEHGPVFTAGGFPWYVKKKKKKPPYAIPTQLGFLVLPSLLSPPPFRSFRDSLVLTKVFAQANSFVPLWKQRRPVLYLS